MTTTALTHVPAAVAGASSPAPLQLVRRRTARPGWRADRTTIPGASSAARAEQVLTAAAALVHRSTGEESLLVVEPVGPGLVRAALVPVARTNTWAALRTAVGAALDAGVVLLAADLAAARISADPSAPPAHLGLARLRAGDDAPTMAGALADAVLVETADGWELALNGHVHDAADGRRLAGQLSRLLRAADDGGAHLDDVDLLSEVERDFVLHEWNDTTRPCPSWHVHEVVAEVARRDPRRVAVEGPDGGLTYAELQTRADAVRAQLCAAGVGRGAPVALLLERSADSLAVQLAAFALAAPIVLLDPEYPAERLRTSISDSGAVVVVARSDAGPAAPVSVPLLALDPKAPVPLTSGPAGDPVVPSPDDVAHLAYTSGSTGTPKAVQLRYGPMRQLMHTLVRACELGEDSRGSWLSSPGLGMVEVDVLPVLGAGGTVCLAPPSTAADPEQLRDWLVDEGVTHALLITSVAERVWELPWPQRTALRSVRIAGERCRSWPPADLPFDVLNVYGSSEATVVALADLTALARSIDRASLERLEPPVGRPCDNVRMYVLDDRGRPVPPGVPGELHVSGESLSKGYLERAGVDASAFGYNPVAGDPYPVLYRTGDIARTWPDGTIEVAGRDDDQVKVRGHRVTLGEVEAVLLAHPDVCQAAVQAVRTAVGDTTLIAHVELAPGRSPSHSALRGYMAERLPSPMVPSRFVGGAIPAGLNGKIDRASLPAPNRARPEVDAPFRAPADERERLLVALWGDALELDGLGALDDFFELGGDSLRGMRLIGRLAEEAGLVLSMQDLQAAATPAGCAPRLRARGADESALPAVVPDPAGAGRPFPLIESQQALWIGRGDAVELGDVGCHGYFEWDNPDLDVDRFRAAWARLVARHPMLRAVVLPDGTQRVLDDVPAAGVPVDDLSAGPLLAAEEAIDAVRARMSHQVLDPATWPLYEVRVTRLPDGHSRVHLSLDMLIVDAWSLYQTLVPDLIELYEDPDAALPALGLTFRDYVLTRERLRETELYARSRRYWLDRIPTLPAAPALPQASRTDEPLRFDRFELDVDPERWQALQARGRERRVTPSGIVVAVFAEVLRAWSTEDAFTINFPVSDRLPVHEQVDRLVGDFTNTLLVAVEKADGTLAERAEAVQQQIWRDLEHRHFTGVEVLREIARREGGPLRAAMPIVLTSLLGHPGHRSSGDLGTEVYGVSQTPQVLLDVQLREIDGTLHVKWDHLPAAFPPGMIGAMFEAFSGLLARMATDDGVWDAGQIDLRSAAQVAVRAAVNSTDRPVPSVTLSELFVQQVAERADAPAVVTPERTVSWAQLGTAAASVADELAAAAAPGPGELVAVLAPKGWQQYVALHAAHLCGAGYLPLDVTQPDARLADILASSGARAVVTAPSVAARAHSLTDVPVLVVGDALLSLPPRAPAPGPAGPVDPAYVIYTSGSTGRPKGVQVAHRAVVNHVIDATERFGLTSRDRQMGTAGLHFDMSVYDVFGPLVHGGSIVLPASAAGPDPDGWLRLAQATGVTFWAAVPSLMELVCSVSETRQIALQTLRRVVFAGDWIPLDLPERVRRMAPGTAIGSCGGPTETTNWSIWYEVGDLDPAWPSIPYGVPMANARWHVVGPDLQHRPDWVPGEMVMESEVALADGYWRDPGRTAERFVTDPVSGARWYRTGDVGRYHPDGLLEILGRDDFQVKVHGHRIELGEIEHALLDLPGVATAAVVATAPGAGARRLVAFAGAEPGGTVDRAQVTRALAERLPAYMVPRDLRVVDALPLTENGKVDRKELISRAGTAPQPAAPAAGCVKPLSALDEVVTTCCAVVLDVEDVPADANFFAAGGDSLTAMRLATLLSDALGVRVPLGAVLRTSTLAGLAQRLADDPDDGPAAVAAAEALREVDAAG